MNRVDNSTPCSSPLPLQGRAGEGFLGDLGYTKHYFAGSERVCSKLGGGMAPAPVSVTDTVVDPLAQEYDEYGNQLMEYLNRLANCTPNELDVYLDFDPVLHGITGEMLSQNSEETEQYFYHPDHLGSSSFITDANGEGYQHLQYLPFGETSVSQKLSSWTTPYQFSAKEKDDETGYSYFGARYYNSDVSIWLSVDPLSDKYPSMSPYMYCAGNPVMLVDPDGRKIKVSRARYRTMDDGSEKRMKWYDIRRADRIDITITVSDMKIIDLTGKVSKEKLAATAIGIQQEILSYWNTANAEGLDADGYISNKKGQRLRVSTVFENDIEVASSREQVKRTDHVIAITSEETLMNHGGSNAGMTLFSGTKNNNILITIERYMKPGFGDYAHEFGHMLGLDDVFFYRKGLEDRRIMYNGAPRIRFTYAPRYNEPLPKPSFSEFKSVQSTGNYISINRLHNI